MSLRKSIGRIIGGESAEEKARKADIQMDLKRIDLAIATEDKRHEGIMKGLLERKQKLSESL